MTVSEFADVQKRVLARFGIAAESRYVDAPAVAGRAHMLVCGEGPPVVLVNGIGLPGAMWAPLMAKLDGFTLHAVDAPGFGLTPGTTYTRPTVRSTAVAFLQQVFDGLSLERALMISNSMGSLWTSWLSLAAPDRVAASVFIGTPALILGTSAPLPMRVLSVPWLGRMMMKLRPPSPKQVDEMAAMVHEDLSALPEIGALLLACERLPDYVATFVGLLHSVLRLRGGRPDMALGASQLARLTQPHLLIWGNDDPFGSISVGRQAAEIIPDAEFHVVPGGHAPWLASAEEIATAVRPFLHRHAGGLTFPSGSAAPV